MSKNSKVKEPYVYYTFGYDDPLGERQIFFGYCRQDESDNEIHPIAFFSRNKQYGENAIVIPFVLIKNPAVHLFLDLYVQEQIGAMGRDGKTLLVFRLLPNWRDKFVEDSRVV